MDCADYGKPDITIYYFRRLSYLIVSGVKSSFDHSSQTKCWWPQLIISTKPFQYTVMLRGTRRHKREVFPNWDMVQSRVQLGGYYGSCVAKPWMTEVADLFPSKFELDKLCFVMLLDTHKATRFSDSKPNKSGQPVRPVWNSPSGPNYLQYQRISDRLYVRQ